MRARMMPLSARLRALIEGAGVVRVIVEKARRPVAITWQAWVMGDQGKPSQGSYQAAFAQPEGWDGEVFLYKKRYDVPSWSLALADDMAKRRFYAPQDEGLTRRIRNAVNNAEAWRSSLAAAAR